MTHEQEIGRDGRLIEGSFEVAPEGGMGSDSMHRCSCGLLRYFRSSKGRKRASLLVVKRKRDEVACVPSHPNRTFTR
jgi:hypothetical protein